LVLPVSSSPAFSEGQAVEYRLPCSKLCSPFPRNLLNSVHFDVALLSGRDLFSASLLAKAREDDGLPVDP
jgi:hypothetical protein